MKILIEKNLFFYLVVALKYVNNSNFFLISEHDGKLPWNSLANACSYKCLAEILLDSFSLRKAIMMENFTF